MQTRMVRPSLPPPVHNTYGQNKKKRKEKKAYTTQLSKEDEVAVGGGDDNEVRREDQEKINRFSRLHQRETVLEDLLKAKQVRLSSAFVSGCVCLF